MRRCKVWGLGLKVKPAMEHPANTHKEESFLGFFWGYMTPSKTFKPYALALRRNHPQARPQTFSFLTLNPMPYKP